MSCIVYGAEGQMPTQQFNKIYLNPFYRASINANTNYSYAIQVTPPDKISSVVSAIITFKAYISPTVNFNIAVNGQACNTPSYTISTTYASAGQGEITFDCSNVINKAGSYILSLRADKNSGAITGWLDLTYMNNPFGSIEISGTEYSPNDPVTVFTQLKDAYRNPVQNGVCYLDVWWPLNGTGAHPYTIQDAPMLQAIGDDDIYYYDMTAPSILGVYMLSAKCSYAYNWQWIYPETEVVYKSTATRVTGTWYGDTVVLNTKSDLLYERCDATAAIACQSTYSFNVSQYGNITNVTTINLYHAGQGDTAGRVVTFAYWNGTTYVNLANTWTVSALGASTTQVGPVDQFTTNSIPITAIIGNKVLIRTTSQTGLARYYNNWLSLALLSSSGTLEDLKSGEIHITNIPNATVQQISSDIPQYVWNYTNKNLTYINWTEGGDYIWRNTDRNLTYINWTEAADVVWNNPIRNLTYINYTAITDDVWGYNGWINQLIVDQFINNTWNYTARYTHGRLYI